MRRMGLTVPLLPLRLGRQTVLSLKDAHGLPHLYGGVASSGSSFVYFEHVHTPAVQKCLMKYKREDPRRIQ